MKKILFLLTRVALNPQRATPYGLFSTDKPQEPYLDSAGVLVLYVAALVPFWVGSAILGIGFSQVLALSVLIWGIGMLLIAIHMNLGLLVVLALGLLSTVNQNLQDMALSISSDLWPLSLIFIYLPSAFALQALARSSKKSLYRWLQVALTLIVGVFGAISLYLSGQLTAAHIWTAVALGALSLMGLGETKDMGDVTSILIVAQLASVVMGWLLYPLIFPPDTWTWWLRVVQGFFSLMTGGGIFGAGMFQIVATQERDFNHSLPLLFFLFVALSPSTPVPSSLLIGLLAVVLTWLASPTWNRFQKGSSVSARITAITACGAVCAFVTTVLIKNYDYRIALLRLLFTQFPPGLDPYGLFIVVGVLFSMSGLHWTTFLAAAGSSIGPLLLNSSGLAIAAGLVGVGVLLGFTRILLWPFLSLLTLWQKNQVQQSTDPARKSHLPAVELANVHIRPAPLGRKSLLVALAQKGVPAEAFETDDLRQEYRAIRANQYARAIGSARTLEEALQMDTSLMPDDTLKSGIKNLREAKNIPGDIIRVWAYARAIRELTSIVEARPGSADSKATAVLPGEIQALESLIQLAYDDIRPVAQIYWETYSVFPDFARTGVAQARWTDRQEIQEGIERCLSRIKTISKELSVIRPHLEKLSREEQGHFREVEEVSRRLLLISRETDYQARSRVIQDSMSRIGKIRTDLEPTWLTIDQDVDRIVEHANPWNALVDALEEPISYLAQLNDRMFEWATAQVVETLEKIQDVEDFISLTKNLEHISGFGERYGPIIDITIESLEGIGRDATAALAFPRGYNRRLGLQDTLDRVNRLRSNLSTRFLLETEDIVSSLERTAQVLLNHLYAEPESQTEAYRNPYVAGNPLNLKHATLFKGRLDLAESIVTLLRSRGNPTIILYGPRRMGKTSFLLQLPRLLPPDYLPVFLDMQQGGAQQSDGSFTYALASAIWKQLKKGASVRRPDLYEHEKHPYTAMDIWLDDVKPLIAERILFFTIDEFETISQAIKRGTLTIQILEHLRSLMQHNENLLLMFAGVQTIDALGPDPASYFISAHPIEISYLHTKEAEELIRNPDPRAGKMPDYDNDVVTRILGLTHCQPYLIQAICSEIIQIANAQQLAKIQMDALDETVTKVLSTSLFFQNIWDDAGEDGQQVLKQIAAGPRLLDEMQISDELVGGLLRRHVISEIDGVYEIEIPLVRDWIRREVG